MANCFVVYVKHVQDGKKGIWKEHKICRHIDSAENENKKLIRKGINYQNIRVCRRREELEWFPYEFNPKAE